MTLDIQREGDSIGRDSGLIGGRLVRYVAETILRNVRVLAIDQNINNSDDKVKVGKTATLEVSPREAEMISVSSRMGDLSLVLRSLALDEESDRKNTFTTDLEVSPSLLTLFRGDTSDEPIAKSAPAPVVSSPQPAKTLKKRSPKHQITVYRGGQATTDSY
jgi:Flp pilus assembly protein CpaB